MKKQIWLRPDQVTLMKIVLDNFKEGVKEQTLLQRPEQTAAQFFTGIQVAELRAMFEEK